MTFAEPLATIGDMRIPLPVPVPVSVNGSDRLLLPVAHRNLRTYEPDSWGAFLDHVRPGDTLVDVGANLGVYAIAAAKRGARVVAVEPDLRTFDTSGAIPGGTASRSRSSRRSPAPAMAPHQLPCEGVL
jgi:hypothetical protein